MDLVWRTAQLGAGGGSRDRGNIATSNLMLGLRDIPDFRWWKEGDLSLPSGKHPGGLPGGDDIVVRLKG